MKRQREDDEQVQPLDASEELPAKQLKASDAAKAAATAALPDSAAQQQPQQPTPAQGDDDERIVLPTSTTRSAVKKGRECPYLDTISRQVCDSGPASSVPGSLRGRRTASKARARE
jgi:hypothetical protein